MERPVFKPLGTPAEELDTPALVVDVDSLKHNIAEVHGAFDAGPSRIRPDVHAHLCPPIASMQLDAPGAAGGIAVSTVGEAQVFAENGVADIVVRSLLVTRAKAARVCSIAGRCRISVVVESSSNAETLSRAASDAGVDLGVRVLVAAGEGIGVKSTVEAVELAQRVGGMERLEFRGLQAGAGSNGQAVDMLLRTRDALQSEGTAVSDVSVPATQALLEAGGAEGVTEVIAGTYALMDHRHSASHSQLRQSAKILATVITHPEPGVAWLDTGQKASSIDTGLPQVDGISGVSLSRMSAEHGGLVVEGDAQGSLEIGQKIWLVPSDIGNCANVYDYIHAVENGNLAAVWDVSARGQYG